MEKSLRVLLFCGVALVASQGAVAQETESDVITEEEDGQAAISELTQSNLIYKGTGCSEPDSVRAVFIDTDFDGRAERLRLTFSDYVARRGPGIPLPQRLRGCAIRFFVTPPPGWQIALNSVLYIGDASLPADANAKLATSYGFPLGNAIFERTVAGPKFGQYQRGDALDNNNLVFSKCGQRSLLGLNTNVSLTGDSTAASISSSRQVYWLHWRKC